MAEQATCKHCGHPLSQAYGGHRRREYCSDACKQAAYNQRREQQHRDDVARRWQAFTAETRNFLDWMMSRYGEDVATAIETAINREQANVTRLVKDDCNADPALSGRKKLETQLLALGKSLGYCRLINAVWIEPGEAAWSAYARNETDENLILALNAAHFLYQTKKELGMLP